MRKRKVYFGKNRPPHLRVQRVPGSKFLRGFHRYQQQRRKATLELRAALKNASPKGLQTPDDRNYLNDWTGQGWREGEIQLIQARGGKSMIFSTPS